MCAHDLLPASVLTLKTDHVVPEMETEMPWLGSGREVVVDLMAE